jgi:hypothetical protein
MEIARMKKREKTLFGSCLGCDIWMDGWKDRWMDRG